jgi:hypothetical protein
MKSDETLKPELSSKDLSIIAIIEKTLLDTLGEEGYKLFKHKIALKKSGNNL